MKSLKKAVLVFSLSGIFDADCQVYEKLYSFTDARAADSINKQSNGENPYGSLIQGKDGDFYGTAYTGGASNLGTIFRMTASGVLTTMVEFTGDGPINKGSLPQSALLQGSDGNFYGTTRGGGALNHGTVFKMTPAGVLTTLVEFTGNGASNKGSNPRASLVQGSDGNFYGTTEEGGSSNHGTVFKITATGELTTLVHFTGNGGASIGRNPSAPLLQANDGNFYGTTQGGGAFGYGTVFKMTPIGVMTTLVEFTDNGLTNKGSQPVAALLQGNDGNFYGTTSAGGTTLSSTFPIPGEERGGTVFKMTPGGVLTTLVNFTGNGSTNKGSNPRSALLQGSDGNFYGTTQKGGILNQGTIFKTTSSGVLTTLVEFTYNKNSGQTNNYGGDPEAAVLQASDGNFYGTTRTGGDLGEGTVFKMAPTGLLTTLVEFTGYGTAIKGSNPSASLVQLSNGDFYGTTLYGGEYLPDGGYSNSGTVFKLTPAGVHTSLVSFTGNATINKGWNPNGLVIGSDGNFYGTTRGNNASNFGSVFKITPSGELTTLAEFAYLPGAGNLGNYPLASLVEGNDGNFYGSTDQGVGGGTIFKITPSGLLTTLVQSLGQPSGLVQGSDGNFYGTTKTGGTSFLGSVFKMTPAGAMTTLVSFTGNGVSNKGSNPLTSLMLGNDGNFYGTTSRGGATDNGTVFKITPEGQLTTLIQFTGNGTINKGASPRSTLVMGPDGNFYGTTALGGKSNFGTVFKMTPAGILSTLVEFSTAEEGLPEASLILGVDGNLYGTTSGPDGSVYRLIFPGSPLVAIIGNGFRDRTSAILEAKINARGTTTSVFFEYGTDEAVLPNMVSVATNLSGYQTKLVGTTLDSLEPGAIYYYRFRAVSSSGTTVSPIQSFSTLASPVASATAASLILPVSARFNGIVNARNFDTTVTFEWGTDGNSFPNTVEANPAIVSGNSDSPVFISVAGLTEGTTYYYRISATNAGGTVTSGTQSFRTLIPATATVTGATALSTTRAQVTGFVDAEGSSAIVSFEYGTDGINFPNSFSASPASVSGDLETQVTATLTGLTQGTTYHVRIRAQGPGGTGLSPVSTFSLSILSGLVQVFPDPPPASVRSVTVNFTPPSVGAWRFTGDTEWRSSGIAAGNLTSGQRVIEFLPVPGFNRPPSETVDVTNSSDITLERGYFETPSVGSGSLTVSLKPDDISAPDVPLLERAQWRIVGEANWRDSGDLIGGLAAGSYLVETKPVAGKETPPTIPVSIADADSRDLTLTYFTANSTDGLPPLPQTYADVSANEDLPFAHVGQIRSEVGSSTGFVVKRRVVATAGHVVFDDGTLSAITNLQWIFQRHIGTHEPRPQTPRGYYLAAGYAAQRDIDQSPGEGSAQSQNLDYAALYFIEEAGRGGYGGFLASDSGDDNEFLNSNAEKILAGYPTSGIQLADSGKQHATAPFTSALSAAFGETWTTTTVRGLAGMSGGPLFVRHQSGSYFPAAIYLGGAGQTVVRAIDSDVVELFLRAEVSGNGGDNNTDGGITHTSVAGNLNVTQAGSLRVNIEPAGANAIGAAWQLNPEATLRQSGSQKSGLSPGTYNLKFKTINGFQPPANQTVNVTGGQLTTITFTYVEAATAIPLETWRQTHFETTENIGDASDNFDFDKDGETNIEEFTAGTDPKNSSDVFKMATTTKSGNNFITTCSGKSGRTYTLLHNTGLSEVWTRLESQGPLASNATVILTDTTAPSGNAFYRIEVSLP